MIYLSHNLYQTFILEIMVPNGVDDDLDDYTNDDDVGADVTGHPVCSKKGGELLNSNDDDAAT